MFQNSSLRTKFDRKCCPQISCCLSFNVLPILTTKMGCLTFHLETVLGFDSQFSVQMIVFQVPHSLIDVCYLGASVGI